MKRNQNGFSLIELMAILFITTAIVAPLINSLVGNIEINERSQLRRSATSIADGSLYGLNKIDYSLFKNTSVNGLLDDANSGGTYYYELNASTCGDLGTGNDYEMCVQLFSTIWNSFSPDETEFKIYMFNYALTSSQQSQLVNNVSIEQEVRDVIANDADIQSTIDTTDVEGLVRIVVWIDYYDDPDLYVTLVGLIFDE